MSSVFNPWLPQPPAAPEPEDQEVVVPVTGPVSPQFGVPAPDSVDQLRTRVVSEGLARLWILGAHGGAGESTIAELDRGFAAASHVWPQAAANHRPTRVLIVSRTSSRGLHAAKAAAKQWAAGLVSGVELVGLVLIADAPGRLLPKPLRYLSKVIGGGYPHVWHVPWIEAWRLGDTVSPDAAPRQVRSLLTDLDRTLLPIGAPVDATTPKGTKNAST